MKNGIKVWFPHGAIVEQELEVPLTRDQLATLLGDLPWNLYSDNDRDREEYDFNDMDEDDFRVIYTGGLEHWEYDDEGIRLYPLTADDIEQHNKPFCRECGGNLNGRVAIIYGTPSFLKEFDRMWEYSRKALLEE